MSAFFSKKRLFGGISYALVAGAVSIFAFTAAARAEVVIDVDLTSQTMHVHSAEAAYDWPVSTARAGFTTPRGHFATTYLIGMAIVRRIVGAETPTTRKPATSAPTKSSMERELAASWAALASEAISA